MNNRLKSIALTGLVAGTLDALAAIGVYDLLLQRMGIVQILQYIATGVFGADAFEGGLKTAAWGVVFHFVIAYAFTIAYFAVAPRIPALGRHRVVAGLAYGAFIWVFMNGLILPFSNVPKAPFELGVATMELVWHMTLVGVPISVGTFLHEDAR